VGAVEPKAVQKAVTAYVKDWVKKRVDAGETTVAIAQELGFKSHVSIVQYTKPGFPVEVTTRVRDQVANILFGGSTDRLKEEAVRWYQEQRPELPQLYDRAVAILEDRHKRDFTEVAYQHLESTAAHQAEGITASLLADQIYEFAQGEKNKSVPNPSTDLEDVETGIRAAAKPKATKGRAK
jgi:hypothetical protein